MNIKLILLICIVGSLGVNDLALAGPASEELGLCMVDSLTGKERKQLAKWVFFAMAAHPEIKKFSKVSSEDQNNVNSYVGKLITRLLTENCSTQVKAANKESGSAAISSAFELVGKVAMQELMSNKEVVASISGYTKFIDNEKLNVLLQ
jgi:hypothetical protein